MKHLMLISVLMTAAAGAVPAKAEPGQFGGGLIELLMTGRDPVQTVRPVRAYHRQRGGVLYAAPEPLTDPFGEPIDPAMRRGRIAALPSGDLAAIRREVPAHFRRQLVAFDGPQKAGTVVIDTANKFLYLVEGGGQATRYGIGVGRPGFLWRGTKAVSMKREWPDWRPPAEMLRRRPDLPRHMPGGLDNPLGARALYLGSSLYRIHGTNEPHTIGHNVSSGCIRLTNDDVVDLYSRVRVGTRVVVL